MKWILLLAALSTMACAKTSTSPAQQAAQKPVVEHPSQELCDKAYDNLLDNVLNNTLGEGESFTPFQLKVGEKLLDQQFSSNGKKQRFYNICLGQASPPMAECWSNATTLEGMDVCTLLWRSSLHRK